MYPRPGALPGNRQEQVRQVQALLYLATHAGRSLTGACWSFLPVYSSYTDLFSLSHGRMPCRHA